MPENNDIIARLDRIEKALGTVATNVSIDALGRSVERLTDEVGTMREEMLVFGAAVNRLDNSQSNMIVEIRAIRSLLDRVLDRVRKTESKIAEQGL